MDRRQIRLHPVIQGRHVTFVPRMTDQCVPDRLVAGDRVVARQPVRGVHLRVAVALERQAVAVGLCEAQHPGHPILQLIGVHRVLGGVPHLREVPHRQVQSPSGELVLTPHAPAMHVGRDARHVERTCLASEVVRRHPALHPDVRRQRVHPVLGRVTPPDAEPPGGSAARRGDCVGRLRQEEVARLVAVAPIGRPRRPVRVVHVHRVATEREGRVEHRRIAGAHEVHPELEVLRRFVVPPHVPGAVVVAHLDVAVVEHAEPGRPPLVEQHPAHLVVEGAIELRRTAPGRGELAVHPAARVPRRIHVGHRRLEHVAHHAPDLGVGGAGGMEVDDGLAGLGEALRPVLDRSFGAGPRVLARETGRPAFSRPEEGVEPTRRRIEGDALGILLEEVTHADGHAARVVADVDPAERARGAIADLPARADLRREGLLPRGRRRLRHHTVDGLWPELRHGQCAGLSHDARRGVALPPRPVEQGRPRHRPRLQLQGQ